MASERKNKFREIPLEIDSNFEEETPIQEIEEPKEPRLKKKQAPPASLEGVMPKKKNKLKETAVAEPEPEKKPKEKIKEQAKDRKEKISIGQRWQQLMAVYTNERTQKIFGLTLILCATYLCIAFLSFFFTWDVDQDKVMGPLSDLFGPDVKVKNWLGKLGALVSHQFMHKWFGVSSFIFVPVLTLYGLQKLLSRQFIKPQAFNAKWLFLMIWSSLTLAFVFHDKWFFLGGGFGYVINQQIDNYVGSIGLLALLGFSMLTFLVLAINISFKLPERAAVPVKETEEETASTEEPLVEFNTSYNESKEPALSEEEEAALLEFEVKRKIEEPLTELKQEEITAVVKPEEPKAEERIELTATVEEPVKQEPAGEPEFSIATIKTEEPVLEEENKAEQLVEQFGEYDPTLDLGHYKFPTYDLLNDYGNSHAKVNQEELVANKDRIIATLKNYGIEIDKIMATVGPTVTLYEIVPAAGVRISKIKNLEDDIALSLAALGIRIIAPIPGKGTIGIEVPNQTPEMVPMRNILASEKFNNSNFDLPIALGKTISNEIFIADLAKMPHLLMAGATGQGKSVGLNAVLVSLLYKKHPAQIKFVLVDPKKVELTLFNKIERHFLAKLPNSEDAIITDNTKVIHTLNSLCIEMDNRYALLQDAQVRNIKEYNTKFISRRLNPNDGHKFLPYIVLVVDEFADLIMTAGKEVETPIARLAQLARAIGIHLIIATQRPSVNIITGTIKANFPARIAFRVTSKIDSRTILDAGGAEQLIGRGDMLLSTGNDLIRIQCAFVDTPEVEKITEFIGAQRAYPSAFMLPEYVGEEGDSGKEEVDLSERDKMFEEAAKLVVQFQQGSASFLQRKLKLGYNRAGRIVDQLEAAGIIGPFEGSKAREVLCKDMAQLDEIIKR
ncbi:MAG: DNA translocase FtsK 4TM domain-containing protein, partial [Bacteroidia bacterium]